MRRSLMLLRVNTQLSMTLFTFGLDDLLDPFFKITLYFLHVLQMLLLHQLFDGIALLPKILGALVAAYMDIAEGEQGGDGGEHGIEERVDLFVGGAEGVVIDSGEAAGL